MKTHFGDKIDVAIHLIDSPEAANYVLRGATTVFLNASWVPLDVATSTSRMLGYIERELAGNSG